MCVVCHLYWTVEEGQKMYSVHSKLLLEGCEESRKLVQTSGNKKTKNALCIMSRSTSGV